MHSGLRSQLLLIRAGSSDFSFSFITILGYFWLASMAMASESLPQTCGGSFWSALQGDGIFTHFKSKPLLADAWQRWVFGDENVSCKERRFCREKPFWTRCWVSWPHCTPLPMEVFAKLAPWPSVLYSQLWGWLEDQAWAVNLKFPSWCPCWHKMLTEAETRW